MQAWVGIKYANNVFTYTRSGVQLNSTQVNQMPWGAEMLWGFNELVLLQAGEWISGVPCHGTSMHIQGIPFWHDENVVLVWCNCGSTHCAVLETDRHIFAELFCFAAIRLQTLKSNMIAA